MNVLDLTQRITADMPVYPGTEKPQIIDATTIRKHGFAEKRLTFYSHTGTHMDAPGHILAGATTLDGFDVSHFMGPGAVIDVTGATEEIGKSRLTPYSDRVGRCDYALLHTGWDKKWADASYFEGFPVLSEEAAAWLCGFRLKGIGIDCLSVDAVGNTALGNHRAILSSGMVIVENLCNLSALIGRGFVFCCFPLNIVDADGSPVRAVGCIDD